MAFQGGNTEKKEIGLSIGLSGTHRNTKIDKATGFLQLVEIDVDEAGNSIYSDEGSWTSDVIDLGDIFQDFEKIFTTSTNNGASFFAVLTRVSDNGNDWSDWTPIALDGTIQSETKQYIQVRIDLFAGFVTDSFVIANSDFEENKYVEEKEYMAGRWVVPKLTSNTSSSEGFAFSETEYSVSYSAWYAFDKDDRNESYLTKAGVLSGFLGFKFHKSKRVSKYKVRSSGAGSYLSHMINEWVLQASNNTTSGHDGDWVDLDTQVNQVWTTGFTDKIFEISNNKSYLAYRIKWGNSNNGNGAYSYSGLGELDFYEEGTTSIQLKREYADDMAMDSTWNEEGSLHRKKITRDEWLRIDKMNVLMKDGDV